MWMRLGELLVAQGLLTEEQVDLILAAQAEGGGPFGQLAETLCGIDGREIEAAWASQYEQITGRIDLAKERVEPNAIKVIGRRQAWQFGILPLRRSDCDLLVATTREHLPRAIRYVTWQLSEQVVFVITSMDELQNALEKHYPVPGMRLTSPPATRSA
jgi:hypothetical protein